MDNSASRKPIARVNPQHKIPWKGFNAEIKHHTDVVGIFPNEPAIRRLVEALLLDQNEEPCSRVLILNFRIAVCIPGPSPAQTATFTPYDASGIETCQV